MSVCCGNTYWLPGCYDTCKNTKVRFGFNAPGAADYVLKLQHLGTEVLIPATFANGQEFQFPTHGLNEMFEYVGQIQNALGTVMTRTVDSVVYNCFGFRTCYKTTLPFPATVPSATPPNPPAANTPGVYWFTVTTEAGELVFPTGLLNKKILQLNRSGYEFKEVLTLAAMDEFIYDPATGFVTFLQELQPDEKIKLLTVNI